MRLTSSRAYIRPAPVPKMPPGLEDHMNGLTREVLLHNPTNVYEFCANHMGKLVEIRDGPSSKKTLEQKIQKAQEKMRLKAKERRDNFDREIKLDGDNTALVHELSNVPGPGHKMLVHQEIDLQNSSEVEISQIPQQELAKVNHVWKLEEINANKEVMENEISEKMNEAKNPNVQVISDEQTTHKKNYTDKEHELDEKSIFGNIKSEINNEETLKEAKLEDIVNLNNIDSGLQTIKETFEENVNDNAIVLPTITVSDEHQIHELENLSDKSFKEVHPNIIEEFEKLGAVEISIVNSTGIQNESDKLEPNDKLDSKIYDKEATVFKNIAEHETAAPDFSNNIKIHTTIPEIQNDDSSVATTMISSEDGNLQLPARIDNNSNDVAGEMHNAVVVLPLGNGYYGKADNKSESDKDDSPNDASPGEKNLTQIKTESSDTSEKGNGLIIKEIALEENTKAEHTREIRYTSPNVNETYAVKMVYEPIQQAIKESEENCYNNYKNLDNIETLLQKSDSTENTNEDSISAIESDMSKTDDDSSQNNPNMDLETAAITIQKVFRSFLFKSRNSTFEDNINDENNSIDEDNDKKEEYYAAANLNKDRRLLGITRMDTVLQTVNEEKSLSLSTDDSSTLSSAATTIQAHVRGFLVRNRLNSSKTLSMNSLVNSHEVVEGDPEQHKNKTILNIHIVPEKGNYLSRDESLITSMDLSLDGSPPSSVNLHPLSCDISERRKMLKREDAVQSVSPPSNNSGKLSEDSVKEVLINENGVLERELTYDKTIEMDDKSKELDNETSDVLSNASTVTPTTIITISKSEDPIRSPRENTEAALQRNVKSLSSDESDVITPSPRNLGNGGNLVHSGEFHDVLLPTKVSRNDTQVVREFKNVLVYFLLWNNS